jgi:hypothetical protein
MILVLPVALSLPCVFAGDAAAACSPGPACLEATFPGAYSWGGLTPAGGGENLSAEQAVGVESTDPWGVKISSDLAHGRMTEWDGLAYVAGSPKMLASPLEWGLTRIGSVPEPAVSYSPLTGTPATIAGGQPGTCDVSTCAIVDVGTRYRQQVSYADEPAGASDYRILVTFEASQGF